MVDRKSLFYSTQTYRVWAEIASSIPWRIRLRYQELSSHNHWFLPTERNERRVVDTLVMQKNTHIVLSWIFNVNWLSASLASCSLSVSTCTSLCCFGGTSDRSLSTRLCSHELRSSFVRSCRGCLYSCLLSSSRLSVVSDSFWHKCWVNRWLHYTLFISKNKLYKRMFYINLVNVKLVKALPRSHVSPPLSFLF